MVEPSKFKSENMMHSIKSLEKSDYDDDATMKEKKQSQEKKQIKKQEADYDKEKKQIKKQEADYDKEKKETKKQEFGWDVDWFAIMEQEKGMDYEKKHEKGMGYEKKQEKDMCYDKKDMCYDKKDMCYDKKDMCYEKKQENKCESAAMKKCGKSEMESEKKMGSKVEGCMCMKCMMMECDMKEHKCVKIGDKIPKMMVQTTMGNKRLPDDYLGKWLILFSHPGDFTPVCTTEFVSFARNYENFKQLDTELLGLSVDQVQPHIKWIEWIEEKLCTTIPFPIIADPMGTVASELGMIHNAKTTQTVRAVFFVDPTGTVRMILHYPAEVGRNMEEIIRSLAALQIADKHKVAMPANWPMNELIKDQVIVPPATTREEARKNKERYSNYDWWFCYKNLE